MAADEDFLRRWSRRKREAAPVAAPAAPSAAPAATPVPELPSLDSLSFDSDFKAFMHAKVEDAVKRAALKKLFSDPRFNVMDGLDIYVDDYSKGEVLSPELLATLEHAKSTLFGRKSEESDGEMERNAASERIAEAERDAKSQDPKPPEDAPRRQDA